MDIQEYLREDGSSPFQEWFNQLDPIAAAKVTIAQSRLALGNTSNIKWFSGIGEYKINWGPGYRIYLAQDGKELIILFGGGTKKDQPANISQAIALHQDYQQRKHTAQPKASPDDQPLKSPHSKQRKKRKSS